MSNLIDDVFGVGDEILTGENSTNTESNEGVSTLSLDEPTGTADTEDSTNIAEHITNKSVDFAEGPASLASEAEDGQFYYATDTGQLFLNGSEYLPKDQVQAFINEKFVLPDNYYTKTQADFKISSNISSATKYANLSSSVTVGGISSGDNLNNKTVKEILDLILNPEFAPVWTDATASIIYRQSADKTISTSMTLAVGTKVPLATAFETSGTTASAGSITGGSATPTKSSTIAFDTLVTSRLRVDVTVTYAYAKGSAEVVTNKGNKTTKTATTAGVNLSSASTNSNIDTDYKIKEITKTATFYIYYAWPVYTGNTANLIYSNNADGYAYQEYTKALTAGEVMTISIPSHYTNVSMQYWDSAANKYLPITFTKTTATKSVNGVSKSYDTYSYSEVAGRGSTKYRAKFKIVAD